MDDVSVMPPGVTDHGFNSTSGRIEKIYLGSQVDPASNWVPGENPGIVKVANVILAPSATECLLTYKTMGASSG